MYEAGRIEGAINVPAATLKNPDSTIKSPDELMKILIDAGLDLSKPIVTYCNSGMQASYPFAALHSAGVTNVALYDGSMSEYVSLLNYLQCVERKEEARMIFLKLQHSNWFIVNILFIHS